MKHVVDISGKTDDGDIHYAGPGLVGWMTLCGYVDFGTFVDTNKRVSCRGCIGVKNFVLGKPE